MGEPSENKFESFADFWAEGEWAPFVEELYPGTNRQHALAIMNQPAGAFPDPAMPEFQIQLIIKGDARLKTRFEGVELHARISPGSMFMAPANTEAYYELDDRHRYASLAINRNAIHRFSDQADFELPSDFGKLHERMFHDPIVEALILRMLEQATIKHPTSDLFLDHATNTILTSLMCRSESMVAQSEPERPLSDDDLAKVSRIIEDRLEENLSIADLARVTSLSDWQFARAFKEATGLGPHQFVLRRRIVRGKDLLSNGILPLAEVAFAAGFSSQSHMSDVFRQKVGTTPGKYRAQFKD
ncbi:MAG: AraC family transcriptional regulator [Pseudomonadota bacterium]